MKRFAFGLERVLELREFGKKLAEAELTEKSGACARLEMGLDDNAKAAASVALERFRPGSGAADHRAAELYSWRLAAERERLLKAKAAAEIEREKARLAYVEASQKAELVSKLKAREEASYYKAVSVEETKIMDDLASGARARSRARA